jgi:hypothetical protein
MLARVGGAEKRIKRSRKAGTAEEI